MNLLTFLSVGPTQLAELDARTALLEGRIRFGSVADLEAASPLPPDVLFVIQDTTDNVNAFYKRAMAGEQPHCSPTHVMALVAGSACNGV